ncbi:MAG: uracil-DNA glycosylase [Pseudomonadota bacterium]
MPAFVAARAPAAVAPTIPATADSTDATDGADDADSTAWFDDAPTPARATPITDEAIAALDWAGLKQAIASCTRCDLCATRRGTVPGRGEGGAGWIAIGAAPSRLDEKENRAITGDGGQLLANMLKAIALAPDSDVHVTNLVKCRPSDADGADRRPTPDEVAACRPFLERELVLSGAAMVLTLGQAAAKGLLGAAARGQVLRYGALPVVATYHPEDLLRRPEDKAKAWADLCLAKAAHAGGA